MKTRKVFAALSGLALVMALGACSSNTEKAADDSKEVVAEEAEVTEEEGAEEAAIGEGKDTAGINELPVGDSGPQTNGPLTVDLVYFQAVDMEQGSMSIPPASESDMHFEVDLVTNEKAEEWGYEPDLFLPYLTITAVATNQDTGEEIDLGTMMPMIAADGPHYGNNIKLPAGNYDVTVKVASPADSFMLHTGKDTSAVKGRFWEEPLTFEFKNWQWDGQLI